MFLVLNYYVEFHYLLKLQLKRRMFGIRPGSLVTSCHQMCGGTTDVSLLLQLILATVSQPSGPPFQQ